MGGVRWMTSCPAARAALLVGTTAWVKGRKTIPRFPWKARWALWCCVMGSSWPWACFRWSPCSSCVSFCLSTAWSAPRRSRLCPSSPLNFQRSRQLHRQKLRHSRHRCRNAQGADCIMVASCATCGRLSAGRLTCQTFVNVQAAAMSCRLLGFDCFSLVWKMDFSHVSCPS